MDLHEAISVSIKHGQGMSFKQGLSKKGFVLRYYNSFDQNENNLIAQLFLSPEAFTELSEMLLAARKRSPELFRTSAPE